MRRDRLALAVGAVAAVYFLTLLTYGINLEDEGLVLHQIARTAAGEIPYVDFHTGYTPGTFWLNAALLRWVADSVLPIRAVLVLVNAAAVALLFALARPLAGTAIAVVAALGWAAFLPCFVGEFASFNVPYPAWYGNTLFLATHWACDRWVRRGDSSWLWLAGLFAGLAFGFKPNTGILAALAVGVAIALLHAGRGDRDRPAALALLAAALVVVLAAFGFRVWMPELWLIAGPMLVLVGVRVFRARGVVVMPEGLWTTVGATAAAGLLVTVPWVGWFVGRLGVGGFVREVLLLGSNADVIYATPYPIPLGFPASWPLVAAVGLLVGGLLGEGVAHGRVARRTALLVVGSGAVAAGGLLALWAQMPEGLTRSITWQVQHVGFYAVPVMLMGVAWRVVGRLRSGGPGLDEGGRALLVATTFGAALFVTLYPRVDTMHLILAMPSALVVAAAVTRRLACTWGPIVGLPPSVVRRGLVAVAAALALVAAVPNWQGLVDGQRDGWVTLRSTRAPIRIEAARATDLLAFDALLDDLRTRRRPGDEIFGFPAMALVPFALGARTPTPHDYFFPGRPDHADEAEIVRMLAAAPPRFVVTLNRRFGFFSEAPAYYFMLREHLRAGYRLAARYGRYDLLVDATEAPAEPRIVEYEPPPMPGDVFDRLADPDREQRRAAILPMLARVEQGARLDDLASTDAERLLVLRNVAEVEDPRGLPLAWDAYGAYGRRVNNEAAGALNFIALRDRNGRWALSRDVAAAAHALPPALPTLDRAKLRYLVLDQDLRLQAGVFAAWALTRLHDAEAAPAFERLVAEEEDRPLFQVLGATGLAELGRPAGACTLVELLGERKHETQNVSPSELIELADTGRVPVAGCVVSGLGDDVALTREVSAWIAGAASLAAAAPALRGALDDPDANVRMAAAWALGRLHDTAAVPALAALREGSDTRLAAFAAEALGRIEGGTT